MTEDLTHILIFRTNIHTDSDKRRVADHFATQQLVEDWNVDMDDIDRVLRIVSHELCADEIIKQINKMGYECQELD